MGNARRNHSGAVRLVPALKAVLLCAFIGGSCVGYALQRNKIYELAEEVGKRQSKLERVKRNNQILADRLSAAKLPQRLAARVTELGLGLVPPEPNQVLWISERSTPPVRTNIVPLNIAPADPVHTASKP